MDCASDLDKGELLPLPPTVQPALSLPQLQNGTSSGPGTVPSNQAWPPGVYTL
jgi:hypothetical protein